MTPEQLRAAVQQSGTSRVVVTLAAPATSSPEEIARLQQRLLDALRGLPHQVLRVYGSSPVLALEVGPDALEALLASSLVRAVTPDAPRRPSGLAR